MDVHHAPHHSDYPAVLTGAYSGYAMTPDGDGDYDFTLLTGSSDNTRSTLAPPT